jgi:hypothetical protein
MRAPPDRNGIRIVDFSRNVKELSVTIYRTAKLQNPLLTLFGTGGTIFRIQDSGFRIQDTGYRIQDSGFTVFFFLYLVSGLRRLGSWIRDSGFIQDAGLKVHCVLYLVSGGWVYGFRAPWGTE